MADIDIGTPAANFTQSKSGATTVDKNNAANGTGTIGYVEIWLEGSGASAYTDVATFSASGDNLTTRDSEALGAVTRGSKQTFSGLDMDVVTGDWIGQYSAIGIEMDTSGGGQWFLEGDQIPCSNEGFTLTANRATALYGESEAGWAGGDVSGVAIAAIAKINGVALADITKVSGVA